MASARTELLKSVLKAGNKTLNKVLGKKPVKRKPGGSTVKKVAPKKVAPKKVAPKKVTPKKLNKKFNPKSRPLPKSSYAVKPRRISFNKSKATLLGTAALGTAAGYAVGSRNKKSSGDKVVPIQRGGAANKGNKGNRGNKVPGASSSEYLTRTPRPNFSATNVKKKPKSTKRQGPGRPTMTSMVAKPPKPRNKNVTRRPKRPSKQGSFGRQMRASRGMGIIMPSKCCSKVLSRPSTVTKKRTCSSYNKRKK